MKRGDLIRHKKGGHMGIVLRAVAGETADYIYSYIDFLWLDDGTEDSAYSGLFEVISESR